MGEYSYRLDDEQSPSEHDPIEISPEKKKVKPHLSIVIPEDFILEEKGLLEAFGEIVAGHRYGQSIEERRAQGKVYADTKSYPFPAQFCVDQIIGTEKPNGWTGLVTGVGASDEYARPQSLVTAYDYAKKAITYSQDKRNAMLQGVDFVADGRDFFVDGDGRHRMFTLKALQKLGCTITISGVQVTELL